VWNTAVEHRLTLDAHDRPTQQEDAASSHDRPSTAAAGAATPSFLDGSGEMATRVRACDWASTPLGPAQDWPPELRTLTSLMLASAQPMFMAWGPSRTWLYNDAFVAILGQKHPAALGRPSVEVWAEAWSFLEPLFDRVFAGTGVHMEDFVVPLDRHGRIAEAHFAFSYTPARDEAGRVVGLFGTCIETTSQALNDRRRADDQQRQRRLFEQAPGFMAILNGPNHRYEFANAAYRRAVGGRELLGRSVREALPELSGQGVFELLDQVYATGERYVAERVPLRLQPAGGGEPVERRLDFIYEAIRDETGAINGIFVEGQDITEAWQAQEAVLANERRQALLITLDDRFRELDDPADITLAGAALLGRALGVSRAGYGSVDLAAETITIERDWTAPGVASLAGMLHFRDYGTYIEDLKNGETVVFSDAFADPRTRATADALQRIDAVAAINMPLTEQRGLVALLYLNHASARTWTPSELVFIRDVAERTRMAAERRRAEKDLQALAASLEQQVAERTAERDRVWRNSRDVIVVVGGDGIFRAVNPAWTITLGHPTDEVVGRSFLDFVWPDDSARTQAGLATAVGECDLTNFENRYRHRDGGPRWISWDTVAEGDTVYAYGRDITAQKSQMLALQQAEEALRQSQRLEAMGQLTGGVAHDFNTLLAVVSNNLYLHKRLSPACEHSAQLAGIQRATDTGAKLTRQLLAFARRQAIRPEVIRLQDELPEFRQVLQTTLGGQVELHIECDEATPAVCVDRAELELAIINLAVNSRDAMPQGGRFVIRARRGAVPGPAANSPLNATAHADDVADVDADTAACEGDGVVIDVEDSGHGIPADLLARVFEPFFTTKEPGRGTGLGLSQVYGFASQAGGRLEIASVPGVSTTVTLRLPGTADAIAQLPLGESPQKISAASLKARVLVVEDNHDVGAATREVLEVAGCEVLGATSGAQAQAWLQRNDAKVDLVLTDLVMPGPVSGVALARWIARERPGLPVLLNTGYSSEMLAADRQGFKVLQKPVTPDMLIAAVREALALS
jgi:PAS domain S-box-containing protein